MCRCRDEKKIQRRTCKHSLSAQFQNLLAHCLDHTSFNRLLARICENWASERCYGACSNGQFTRQHMKGAMGPAQMDNLQGNI